MRRCPITYELLSEGERRYSRRGLRQLSSSLQDLDDIPFSAEEQRREAERRATRLSIQGVQPKLSARLAASKRTFEVVDRGGLYILKPQTERYPQLPENEDLTMRLARVAGVETPFHGLAYSRDGTLTYFIRRFDRSGRRGKLAVEDFAQLAGRTRDTKYDFSMERLVPVLDAHATFPALERLELFRRTLVAFLTGNEDMHLKNFSLIVTSDGTVRLSPAYDFVNSTIALAGAVEELALPLRGKKRGLTREDIVDYYGRQRLELTDRSVEEVLGVLTTARVEWEELVAASFLDDARKKAYLDVVRERAGRLGLGAAPRRAG